MYDVQNNHKPKKFAFYSKRSIFSNFIHFSDFSQKPKPSLPKKEAIPEKKESQPKQEKKISTLADNSKHDVVIPQSALVFAPSSGNMKQEAPHFWIRKKVRFDQLMGFSERISEGSGL